MHIAIKAPTDTEEA